MTPTQLHAITRQMESLQDAIDSLKALIAKPKSTIQHIKDEQPYRTKLDYKHYDLF